MYYMARTGTAANLAVARAAGWGLLISASGVHRDEGFDRIGLDNGAWSAHQQGAPWDAGAFERLVAAFPGADFVVVPDVVGQWDATRALFAEWAPRLADFGGWRLLAVQDGAQPRQVADMIDRAGRIGIFVGGSTRYKLATLGMWGAFARANGVWCHVGRVNSLSRFMACREAGITSADGSGAARWAIHGRRVARWMRQGMMFEHGPEEGVRVEIESR